MTPATTNSDLQWLVRAVALLADSLSAWEDEEESVQEEKADHIADLNQFFDEYMASKVK